MEFLNEGLSRFIINILEIILILIILGLVIYKDYFKTTDCPSCENNFNILEEKEVVEEEASTFDKVEVITYSVDIKGAVVNPGVYVVNEGTIINDVINLAGGLKSNASTKYINLSKKVTNEMIINIYTAYEISQMKEKPVEVCNSNNSFVMDCNNASTIVPGDNNTSNVDQVENDKKRISINNGTLEELMSLSGIGEAKAKAIIAYREQNGPFLVLEDITKVSGIGKEAFEKIKDNIEL